jgi:hypothetical protein
MCGMSGSLMGDLLKEDLVQDGIKLGSGEEGKPNGTRLWLYS